MHPLLQRLRELDLPAGDYAIFGSGPLLVRGWIDEVGDLDVIARGSALEAASHHGEMLHLEDHDVDVIGIDEAAITVGASWPQGDFDIDALIDTAEIIDGFPCVRLEHVVAYKLLFDRPKDRAHLEVIRRYWSR